MKNCKKYGLKQAKKPKKHALLSGVVHVGDPSGKGFSYFSFTESFVDAVGKALPQGLSPSNPGYLKVLFMPGTAVWRVFAMYLGTERGVLLWEEPERPTWLGELRRAD